MKRQFKVRFNLGKGENYMKWKVESPDGVNYYKPDDVQLLMYNCVLKNQRKTAEKIHAGADKTVCAWIKCEEMRVNKQGLLRLLKDDEQLKYNPRVLPHWFSSDGSDLDNQTFDTIVSVKTKLFKI